MSDPGYKDLASWDDGKYDVHRSGDHTTVSGTIDGQHYHVSWDGNGDNTHSTLVNPSDGGWWTVDHESGEERKK